MKNIKVGQKCYMVMMNVGRNEGPEIIDAEVSKSGNKYITVNDRYRFELRNEVWTEDNYCGERRYLFFSKQDVNDVFNSDKYTEAEKSLCTWLAEFGKFHGIRM